MTLAELLEDFNRGVRRARAAYRDKPTTATTVACACGRRTSHHSGRCKRCRRREEP